MQDIIEALKTRINSPVLGYFTLALVAINWKAFFYLFVQDGDVLPRITFFESNTSTYSLIVWPLMFSVVFAVFYPWLIYFLVWLTTKPIELRDVLRARSEHKLIMMRKELEETQSRVLANAEIELIERAKRDMKLDEIQDNDLKNKIKGEIENLRRKLQEERERLMSEELVPSNYDRSKELMDMAESYRVRAKSSSDFRDRDSLIERARQLEEEAHKLILKGTAAPT